MSRIFISHSSKNDDVAIALRDWLDSQGWAGADDVFLDLDPERGIAAGERWRVAFEKAITRCEAVLFVVSNDWLNSKWCNDEYHLATIHNKPLFALLVEEVPRDKLPGGMAAQWQYVPLRGEPARRFITTHPKTQRQCPVHIAETALVKIKRGLEKAGVSPSTFDLASDPAQPTGWRMPYRGLEALEPQDAAVFFGRDHDIVRGLDELRGLASNPPPRLMVILGASGAGKSSYLRAGLWPRLARDDLRWLPLLPIRAGRGGALEGSEGLISALEDVHRRLGLKASRADLRKILMTSAGFVDLLTTLRSAAASRALRSEPPFPLPVICLDQAEELFAVESGTGRAESERVIALARAAMDRDAALVLATIRSDSYNAMQTAKALAGIHQHTFSLGPVPSGEMANIIREPAKLLRRKVGTIAPEFDDAVVRRLQDEVAGEADALPLLAFVLERLMRENAAKPIIGITELNQTGGISDAIKAAAEAALNDAGIRQDDVARRNILRRLFIPALARIEPKTRVVQRRTARMDTLDSDLVALAKSLTARRLLVTRTTEEEPASTVSVEVAHEALLRRWTVLDALLAEDRDALMLLDATLVAADDWTKAQAARQRDFIVHHGSRLADAQALASRGPGWARDIAAAKDYLSACAMAERTRLEKEARAAKWLKGWAVVATVMLMFAMATNFAAQQAKRRAAKEAESALLSANAALLSQSKYLTNAATADFSDPNTISPTTAALYALAALPDAKSEDPTQRDRPHYPPAELILADTLRYLAEKRVLAGHMSSVTKLMPLPDGRLVAGLQNGEIRIWQSYTAVASVLRGNISPITALLVLSDGRLVSGAEDGSVNIWDLTKPSSREVLRGKCETITTLIELPDGRLAAGSNKQSICLWDTKAGTLTIARAERDYIRTRGVVKYLSVRPDGRLASASDDGVILLWDLITLSEPAELAREKRSVTALLTLPDNKLALGFDNGITKVFDLLDGRELRLLKEVGYDRPVTALALLTDGRLISGTADGAVLSWDETSNPEKVVSSGDHEITSLVVLPDGRIAAGSRDRTIRLVKALLDDTSRLFKGHLGVVTHLVALADGSLASASTDGTIRIWSTKSLYERQTVTTLTSDAEDRIVELVPLLDGRLALVTQGGALLVYNPKLKNDPVIIKSESLDKIKFAMQMPNGLLAIATISNQIEVWDPNLTRETSTKKVRFAGSVDFFSLADGRLGLRYADGTIKIYDITDANAANIVIDRGDETMAMIVLSDGRVARHGKDGTIRIGEVGGRTFALLHKVPSRATSMVALSSGILAVGTQDGEIHVIDIAGKAAPAIIKFGRGPVASMMPLTDNRLVASSEFQEYLLFDVRAPLHSIVLWRADRLRAFMESRMAVTQDGRLAVSSGAELLLWEMPKAGQALVDEAKATVARCFTEPEREAQHLLDTALPWCTGQWPNDGSAALWRAHRQWSETNGSLIARQSDAQLRLASAALKQAVRSGRADLIVQAKLARGAAALFMGKIEVARADFVEVAQAGEPIVERLLSELDTTQNKGIDGEDLVRVLALAASLADLPSQSQLTRAKAYERLSEALGAVGRGDEAGSARLKALEYGAKPAAGNAPP